MEYIIFEKHIILERLLTLIFRLCLFILPEKARQKTRGFYLQIILGQLND